jgi:hypothetical protein
MIHGHSTCSKSSSRVSSILRSRVKIAGFLLLLAIGWGAISLSSTSNLFDIEETSPTNVLDDSERPVNSIVPLPRIDVDDDSPPHTDAVDIWKTPLP